MSSLVAKTAPDFTANAVLGDDRFDAEFTLSSLRGRNVVLLFYPLDFSFVCPSEIIAFDSRLDDFHRRDTEVVGISVDSHYTHRAWKKTPVTEGGVGPIRFPLVSDIRKDIARAYGVLHNEEFSLRGLFLIDRDGLIRHSVVNDLPLGRSVDEALRMVDALRLHQKRGELCPANWRRGQNGMEASPDGVVNYLSRHAKKAG